jgi:hypothetical protein
VHTECHCPTSASSVWISHIIIIFGIYVPSRRAHTQAPSFHTGHKLRLRTAQVPCTAGREGQGCRTARTVVR